MNIKSYINIVIFALFIIISNSLFIVKEAEQALVTQFGKPVGNVITNPGLHFKLPLIHTVNIFDKRILQWDGSANEIPTKDNKRGHPVLII